MEGISQPGHSSLHDMHDGIDQRLEVVVVVIEPGEQSTYRDEWPEYRHVGVEVAKLPYTAK